MRKASNDITTLCETWWDHISHSTKKDQHQVAEALLALLGWEHPIPFSSKITAKGVAVTPYLLRGAGQTTLTAYFLLPGALEPPASLLERGLDYCPATRLLVDEAQAVNVNYVFITDLYRSYLYDACTDDLILYANTPAMFNEEFTPVLTKTNIERGALEEVRRQPRSVVARQYREWTKRWMETITLYGRLTEEQAGLVMDRLAVIRYLFDRDILRRTKWRLQKRFFKLLEKAGSNDFSGCGEELVKLFHDMWFDWQIDLFEGSKDIDEALRNDGISMPLLKEFALLSKDKFSIATILESFNYGEPAEKMRVRMVPDINEEREHYLGKQNLDTIDEARIEIDLVDEGYRAIFHWFDKVVALYERLEVDFDTKTYETAPPAEDLDLFAWSEMDSARPDACADKLSHACDTGFGVYYNSPRQYRIARLLLTLHLISRYDENRLAVNTFPSLKNVMMERPVILPAERVMNRYLNTDPGEFY